MAQVLIPAQYVQGIPRESVYCERNSNQSRIDNDLPEIMSHGVSLGPVMVVVVKFPALARQSAVLHFRNAGFPGGGLASLSCHAASKASHCATEPTKPPMTTTRLLACEPLSSK
jgi:hypothetical protein